MTTSGFLTKSTAQSYKGTSNSVIAGNNAGKRVLCSHSALPIYNDLVKLAKNGNYWAHLIVSGISGLSAGRLNKDNIYIDKSAGIAYGKGAFYMVLPGVTATFRELPNGAYILQTLKADTNYLNHQQQSTKPGLWRVSSKMFDAPEFQETGEILKKEYRPVTIPDMTVTRVEETAAEVRKSLSKTNDTISNMIQNQGFDMHFTPGEGSSGIVGLKKASQALATEKDQVIVESAILLANTMYQARNIEGIQWCSDWGGSAVLTRALQILHQEKGVKKLNGHSIFLNRPTSNPQQAIELAGHLSIKPLGEGRKTGFNPKEIRGHIIHTEIGANKQTGTGFMKTVGFGVGAAGTGFGIASAALSVPGVVSASGALFFIGATLKSAHEKLKGKKY